MKMNPDQIAMIVADMEHGELTTCKGFECDNCALNKELPLSLVGNRKATICNVLTEMSVVLNEVEHDKER